MKRIAVMIGLFLIVASPLYAYWWRTHNRATFWGRTVARRAFTDEEFRDFLNDYAKELDTRAGDSHEGEDVDEDETEGWMTDFGCGLYVVALH